MTRKLSDLASGEAWVVRLENRAPVRRRLHSLGLRPGISLAIIGQAPGGGPIEISLSGTCLALRREEAALVWVDDEAS